ncbi:hypothetical protein Asera_04330 [Actinocatenispora sera]|uniref:Uncharacterized protein n=1 Tax=Actinocatenispora sera TaxID=390989 RepID=A0A810KUI1_9ACTN|nr:hypothetical protein Asera_04330 [Actinocatenispora sera]
MSDTYVPALVGLARGKYTLGRSMPATDDQVNRDTQLVCLGPPASPPDHWHSPTASASSRFSTLPGRVQANRTVRGPCHSAAASSSALVGASASLARNPV